MRAHHLAWAGAGVLAACSVQINDYRGRACDMTHPCVDGWTCVAGTCQSGDGGPASDGGPVWRQWVDGFTSAQVIPSTCCTLDAGSSADGNVVTAHNAAEGAATALGAYAMPNAEGQVRGHLKTTDSLPVDQTGDLVTMTDAAGNPFLRLSLTGAGNLTVYSGPGALQADALSGSGTIPGWATNTDFLIEVAWAQGGARTTTVNGAPFLSSTAGSGATGATLRNVSLGLTTDAGTNPGFSVTLSRWQIGPDPNVTLTE